MAHWLQVVVEILKMNTSNLRALAIRAGGDPRTFYKGASLVGVDVRGQDLRGMEFSFDELPHLIRDQTTKFDSPGEIASDSQTILLNAMTTLTPREEQVMRTSLGIGTAGPLTLGQIGKQFGFSRERARQIISKACRKLERTLGENKFILSDSLKRKRLIQEAVPKAEAALRRINAAPRQEERLAMVLKTLIIDPFVGHLVLAKYQTDKAKFATNCLMHLRAISQNNGDDQYEASRLAARLIGYAIPRAYPLSKGMLLLMLAKHLSEFYLPNTTIRSFLDRSRSMFVNPYRPEIGRMLDVGLRRAARKNTGRHSNSQIPQP